MNRSAAVAPLFFKASSRTALLAPLALAALLAGAPFSRDTLTFDAPQCAGLSGFRAHWDRPIPVAEDGERLLKDSVVKDRGLTAVWGGEKPGPLAFDAVHRSLLVRFPGAAEKIAGALAAGKAVGKAELVLPYLDEEIWPTGSGGADYPCADGYRYRPNWDCDRLYRAQRPNWHAVAFALRRPWQADPAIGPTFNAAVRGAVYWKRFGASDAVEDRVPVQLGPAEVSSYKPEGRMDVTPALTDPAFGKTPADRLRALSDCGFIVGKQEVYDARYYLGAYEWAVSTGPRAILIRPPKLIVTLKDGRAETVALPAPADVAALAQKHRDRPLGAPTAVVPAPAEVARLNEKFMARPAWMPEWQYRHVRQLMGLESGGMVHPFYYRAVPQHVINRAREVAEREAKQRKEPADLDYAVYLAWIDWIHGRPPRFWDGHLTGADNATQWYACREAMPGPVQESILRSWTAWLMPDRETQLDPKLRRQYDDVSGKLVHPMVDDPRVGKSRDGKPAEWNQGDTYYRLTGDWRGNKSYYRSGFTREMSTANFNSSASAGALLNGQIIGSELAMADGRAGLMQFPFWMWTYGSGVGQEYIDHYYWAIAIAGNKMFPDLCARPEDRMAGQSILFKTVNDLANGWHPNLRKLVGGATSRTYYEHVLGQQDGLYHILHVLSPKGALCDLDTGTLPALTAEKDDRGNAPRPISAWGHDYPAAQVALQSLSGPWSEPWLSGMIEEKPIPWHSLVEKEGDPLTTWFGVHYGLASIRQKPQRLHVLGHWRRKAELPSSMRDIGTLDLRIGFNQTRIANDGEGVISEQGKYRTWQHRGRLIMLARPQPAVIARQAAEHQFGQRKVPAREIRSVQCTAALFNFEQPGPTWEIFVDDRKVGALPAAAKHGQTILVRDGVSYLAIRPLPADDLGRDVEIGLEAGQPQTQPYHEFTRIQPALLVNSYIYKKDEALAGDALKRLEGAQSGFVVEISDAAEFGSFEKFRAHVLGAKLGGDRAGVTYRSGPDTLAAGWDSFTVNGQDPHARLLRGERTAKGERSLWQDTPVSQMGKHRLEKNGAVVDRGSRHPELALFLHALPAPKLYVATNPTPCYVDFGFREPGGVRIIADGACSMGRWAVRDSREIEIAYHPFGGDCRPAEKDAPLASVLFVSGAKARPKAALNGKDVSAALRAWKQDGADGWLVPLDGATPKDEEIAARLRAMKAALETR